MNLKLKTAIKKYLADVNENREFLVSKENLDKYLKFFELESDNSFILKESKTTYEVGDLVKSGIPGDEDMPPFILTEENWTEDVYHVEFYSITLELLYTYGTYHYFDLIDGTNNLVFNSEAYIKPMNKEVKNNFLEKWEDSENNFGEIIKRVVISHAQCSDGAGVVAVVKHHQDVILEDTNCIFSNIEYKYLDYNTYNIEELAKELTGKLVYVGDFSFKIEELEILEQYVEAIVVVDHHLDAFKNPSANKDNVHVDMTASGVLLAYQFFFGKPQDDKRPPYAIELLSDRDLWNFFYGDDARAFQFLLKKEGYDVLDNYMSEDMEVSYTKLIDDLVPYYQDVENEDKKYIEKASKAIPYDLNGITVYGLNLTSSVSEVLNHVSRINKAPSLAYWFNGDTDTMQFSFRNYTDDVNVSTIANYIGGGGHEQASGSLITINDIDVESLFKNKVINVYYSVTDDKTESFFNSNITEISNTPYHMMGYVTTEDCTNILNKLNKPFEEVFEVERDKTSPLLTKPLKIKIK